MKMDIDKFEKQKYELLKSSEMFFIHCIEKSDCEKCKKMQKELKLMEAK